MPRSLAVVVPNHDGAHVLGRCLAALAAQTRPPDEVLVVDDASRDGSADAVERDWPGVRVLRRPRNGGFGATANDGVRAVGTELVAVLNSDARPAPDWAAQVAGFAREGAWSWGGVLTSRDGLLESAGDCCSPAGYSYKQWQGRRPEELPAAPYEVFAPPGAAPVFVRERFLELGGYDARYFLYFEDLDLAFRGRARGWTSWVLPAARVEHDMAASSTGAVATRYIARNGLWCHVANAPGLHPRLVLRTSRQQLARARAEGVAGPWLRGRASAGAALPRLLAERRRRRAASVLTPRQLAVACDLGPPARPAPGRPAAT